MQSKGGQEKNKALTRWTQPPVQGKEVPRATFLRPLAGFLRPIRLAPSSAVSHLQPDL